LFRLCFRFASLAFFSRFACFAFVLLILLSFCR
jgi:hypothetical protein